GSPFLLRGHDGMHDVEVFVVTGTTGQHETGGSNVLRRGRELAEDEADLVGVHVFGLEFRPDFLVPNGAVTAGNRRVFDHGDLGTLCCAQRHIAFRGTTGLGRATRHG